ncbi:hypothetical protein ACWFQ8_32930 [Streptomyces sp. NPDC055254]
MTSPDSPGADSPGPDVLGLSGFLGGPGSADPQAPTCSAKGCRAAAVWVLAWNNPKLHTPERRKTWLACGEHREHLSQFLGVRGFLKDVVELDAWVQPEGSER